MTRTQSPALAPGIAANRPRGLYEWLSVVGAVAYLTLPVAVVFPQIFEFLAQVPKLEGERLAGFASLMTVVAPIGALYLFAVWNRFTSLIDLTILWRLAWVGPWLLINLIIGSIELGGALVIGALDIGLPLAALLFDPRGRQLLSRLKAHFATPSSGSLAQRLMGYEARVGFFATTAVAIYLVASSSRGYVSSLVIAVVGLYYVYLAWAAKQDGAATLIFSLLVRLALVVALIFCQAYGFERSACLGFAILAGFGLFFHGYTALWERQTRGVARWSVTRWLTLSGLSVMALSVLWAAAAPWYSQTCTQLAVNIHRQDLIIGTFAVFVGLLLLDIKEKAPLHTTIISWLLPAAAVWFTLETKLLCNLDVGSPFHPSWHERGLAPVYANVVAVDLTFSLATILMTAISTNYVALVLLRYLPRAGWRLLPWHGILIIALSALWMIAASSGVPAPVNGLPAAATIPPFIPVDAIAAVSIHVRDLLVGIGLIGAGLALDKVAPDSAAAAKWTVVGAWVLFVMPKLYLHLHL